MNVESIQYRLTSFWRWLRPFLTWQRALWTAIYVVGVLIVLAVAGFFYLYSQVPDPDLLANRRISESTKIYDRTGKILLYDVHGEEKRTIVPLNQIAEAAKLATIASEDSDFYRHKGLDWRGILRAAYKDFTSASAAQGGSTITQQLIKNSLLGQEKTFSRKIKEIIILLRKNIKEL